MKRDASETFGGVLLGTAVGDALGLPAENLSPERIHRLWKGDWRMRFIAGRGMISDDTEHTLFVAQSLLTHPEDPEKFQQVLAWKLRWWFASLPAGVGLATARACIKLWLGFSARNAAVRSAGSGPAMRSTIIGAFFSDDPVRRRSFVLASSRLTHRSWQAETAALAVAECAALASKGPSPREPVFEILLGLSPEPEWRDSITKLQVALGDKLSVQEFAVRNGLARGVSGYALHVALIAIYAWLRHPADYRTALISVLECGGDTDTAGAITGAICGASIGAAGIPKDWVQALSDWPRSSSLMLQVAKRLAQQQYSTKPVGPVPYFWPAVPLRNAVLLAIVLLHGFRRLAPPY
jgi:ADP-ribosylglycohydrolase